MRPQTARRQISQRDSDRIWLVDKGVEQQVPWMPRNNQCGWLRQPVR